MSILIKSDKPITYLITKGNLTPQNFAEESQRTLTKLKSAIDQKISLIQIREKNLPAKFLLELASNSVELAKNTKTKILVNERIDIALSAHADGVHLTSNSIPIKIVRQNVSSQFIIGVSTHNLKEAEKAKNDGADFITFSPIFLTLSKANYGKPKGLKELRQVCNKLKPFPVLALGGIDNDNFESTLENGASGFAGISLFDNY